MPSGLIRRIPASALTRAPGGDKSVGHGGVREGAGRKPLAEGRVTRCYALTPRHVELLDRYRNTYDLGSASEALRHLIDTLAMKGTES